MHVCCVCRKANFKLCKLLQFVFVCVTINCGSLYILDLEDVSVFYELQHDQPFVCLLWAIQLPPVPKAFLTMSSAGWIALGSMRNQLAHIIGAWVFVQALLDVYGYVETLATGSPDGGPLSTEQTSGSAKENMAARCPEDDMLVDTGFFAQSSFSKEAKAAAHEVLVRVLETGPSSLEPVKEAVGALRALAAGVLEQAMPETCQSAPSVQQAIKLAHWCAA